MKKIALPIIFASILLGASPFIADEVLLEKEQQFSQNMTAISLPEEVTSNGTRVGVNPGTKLDFGEVETGVRVTKFLEYSSEESRLVKVKVTGNITEKINTTEAQMIQGDKRIGISFLSEDPGYYAGETSLKTLTPKGELGELWLDIKTYF